MTVQRMVKFLMFKITTTLSSI